MPFLHCSRRVVFKKTGFHRFFTVSSKIFLCRQIFHVFHVIATRILRGGVTPELFEGGKIVCRV